MQKFFSNVCFLVKSLQGRDIHPGCSSSFCALIRVNRKAHFRHSSLLFHFFTFSVFISTFKSFLEGSIWLQKFTFPQQLAISIRKFRWLATWDLFLFTSLSIFQRWCHFEVLFPIVEYFCHIVKKLYCEESTNGKLKRTYEEFRNTLKNK